MYVTGFSNTLLLICNQQIDAEFSKKKIQLTSNASFFTGKSQVNGTHKPKTGAKTGEKMFTNGSTRIKLFR